LSKYDRIVDLAGIKISRPFRGRYERESFSVEGIEMRAYTLANVFLSDKTESEDMKNSVVKQLSLFRGAFFHLAVMEWYFAHCKKCQVDLVTGLSIGDLQTLPIFQKLEVGRMIRTRYSSLYVDALKQIGECVINRTVRFLGRKRTVCHQEWLILAFTKTAWSIVEPLAAKLKKDDWSLCVRNNVLNSRKRAFVSWLKMKQIKFSYLLDFPGWHTLLNGWYVCLGNLDLRKLCRTARLEFHRKVNFWERVLITSPPKRIIMLEEFLDTSNVLNFVRNRNNWDIKLINFMHGSGYYNGITPVDFFGVFGTLFEEKYIEMGNAENNIVVTGTSAILPIDQAKVYTLDDMDPLAKHIAGRPVLTYFSQYNRGSSSEAIRSRIASWLDEFCRNNNVALVIKLHPAERQNIFTDCKAVVVQNEYPLELFFNISKVCSTFYSFAGIQAVFGGCPALFINPYGIPGLYMVDHLQEFQVCEKDELFRRLSSLMFSNAGRSVYLEKQQEVLNDFFAVPLDAETIVFELKNL